MIVFARVCCAITFGVIVLSAAFGQVPPAQYDRPYGGHQIKRYVPLAETKRRCNSTGCTYMKFLSRGVCYSFIAVNVPAYVLAWTERAERAHCLGWRYPGDTPRRSFP